MRLEAQHGTGALAGPTVIFLYGGTDGESLPPLQMGGGTLSRNDGETEAAFIARASDNPAALVFLAG